MAKRYIDVRNENNTLRSENALLKRENARLKRENAELSAPEGYMTREELVEDRHDAIAALPYQVRQRLHYQRLITTPEPSFSQVAHEAALVTGVRMLSAAVYALASSHTDSDMRLRLVLDQVGGALPQRYSPDVEVVLLDDDDDDDARSEQPAPPWSLWEKP